MPTTWNLNKQFVEPVMVSDNALQWIFSILEMPGGSKHYQALTQSEVLHFVGWMPFYTLDEFD